jgi:RNA polymerase sigma-B factor
MSVLADRARAERHRGVRPAVGYGAADRKESVRLLERYHQERNPADRDALVVRFLPLALHLAHRYRGGVDDDDLEQVASVGLIKALDRFDPTRGIAFSSFAVPTILGELKRYFRDHGWSVRVPRDLQDLATRVDRVSERLTAELGRSPTVDELADRCGASAEQVLEARATVTAHRPDSLDRPLHDDDDDDGTRAQLVAQHDPGYARAELGADLDLMLAELPARERTVLRLRFQEDLLQREIAARMGLSQMHVSRLINRAIDTLRAQHAPSRSDREERRQRPRARVADQGGMRSWL